MATLDDYTLLIVGIVGTLAITVVGGLILRHLNIIGKTSDKATIATFNIGGMQEDFKDLKKSMDDAREHTAQKIDGLFQLIEKKDEIVRTELRRMSDATTELDKKMIGVELRLKMLERAAQIG